MHDPLICFTDTGVRLQLASCGPKVVQWHAERAATRGAERAIAARLGAKFAERRACLEPAKQLLTTRSAKNGLSISGSCCLRAAVCDATTNRRV